MILSGKELAFKIKTEIKNTIDSEKEKPCLVTILVGDNTASKLYVANKEKACNEVGIVNITKTYPETITEEELIKYIEDYNNNHLVDGILVQLPLPKHINTENILSAIDPKKDVDGFHPQNVADLWLGRDCIIPCTPKGIVKLLESIDMDLCGKKVVVVGRSNIVGLPISKLCLDRNATVTICHSKTKNLKDFTLEADVLIFAVGKPNFITYDMVKVGAVVIDVGINRVGGKLCGDVDFENVQYKTSYITPVPGGVGPMTVACLRENTLETFKNK